MQVERLKTLARFLNTKVDNKEFDISYWINTTNCGTTCCALGWACSIPEFQAAGLTLWNPLINDSKPVPCYKEKGVVYRDFDAAVKFFDITDKESLFLFSSLNYKKSAVSSKTVSRRIYQLIKDYETKTVKKC